MFAIYIFSMYSDQLAAVVWNLATSERLALKFFNKKEEKIGNDI